MELRKPGAVVGHPLAICFIQQYYSTIVLYIKIDLYNGVYFNY